MPVDRRPHARGEYGFHVAGGVLLAGRHREWTNHRNALAGSQPCSAMV
jgi:hypothetical protein